MAKKNTQLAPPEGGFDLNGDVNNLPDPVEGFTDTAIVAAPPEQFLSVDNYHGEVANRSTLRRKIFIKWDTGNGFFKVGDDIVACGPNQSDLLATVVKVNYPWQYWSNMQLLCENPDPGVTPQMGMWREPTGVVNRACDTCPKNQNNGAKGDSCKDALQIAMTVLINGVEKMVGMQTANFKVVGDFDDFLDVMKVKKLHLNKTTISIGRGPAISVRDKKMFGWNIKIVAKQPLSEYAATLED